jgi:hypothetical protein
MTTNNHFKKMYPKAHKDGRYTLSTTRTGKVHIGDRKATMPYGRGYFNLFCNNPHFRSYETNVNGHDTLEGVGKQFLARKESYQCKVCRKMLEGRVNK